MHTVDVAEMKKRGLRTREQRGIVLAHEHGAEFAHTKAYTWSVPGCDGGNYTVDLERGACTCSDYQMRRSQHGSPVDPCKHIYAVECEASKRRTVAQRRTDLLRAAALERKSERIGFTPGQIEANLARLGG
jgi:hypothetical protein